MQKRGNVMKDYEKIAIDKLKPYENNARTHSEEQIEMIMNSLREFGFVAPCIIDENDMILVGHGRIEAAKRLGIKEVPYRRITHLTEDKKKAYILADNKLSDMGGWDLELLDLELGDIELDMSEFGFEEVLDDEYGTDFTLPDGEKSEYRELTFTLHQKQWDLIEYAMSQVVQDISETFGNSNANGNALYEVVRQWAELKK